MNSKEQNWKNIWYFEFEIIECDGWWGEQKQQQVNVLEYVTFSSKTLKFLVNVWCRSLFDLILNVSLLLLGLPKKWYQSFDSTWWGSRS